MSRLKKCRTVNLTPYFSQALLESLESRLQLSTTGTASITATLWNDSNSDGVYDSGESPTGVRQVFIDTNGNGKLDAGEPTTNSNASGVYTFSNLAAGTYNISRVFPNGYRLSNSTTNDLTVTVAAGQKLANANLGTTNLVSTNSGSTGTVTTSGATTATASISGTLWNDSNGNGVVDSGESPTGARQIFIDTNGNGKLDAGEITTTSHTNGNYSFANLPAGTYNITRVFPSGYHLSNSKTADITVTITAGQQLTNVNLGTTNLSAPAPGSTSGSGTSGTSTGTSSTGTSSSGSTGAASAGSIPVNASAVKPKVVISALSTSITANESIFVNGLSSTVGVGTIDTARLQWNFGDPSGAYNTLVGFSAGHTYSAPGKYTVTLSVWNQSNGFSQATLTVNVAASTRSQIYVSAAGSDSNSGSSSSSPVKTFARATQLIAGRSNVEVLFRDGDTFSATTQMNLGGANVHVTSYGSGAKPVIRYDGPLGNYNVFYVGGNNATIENITIDSKYTGPDNGDRTGMPFAINLVGDQSTVRNVTFLNVGYAVQTNSAPDGVMVQGCDAPTTYGLRAYLVWCQGQDFVILGNKVVNSTNEHAIRVWDTDRILIAYNDLANPQDYSFETSKTCLNVQGGSYVSIENNTLRGPRAQIGPLGGADGITDKSMRLHDVLFENNTVLNTTIEVDHGVSNIYVRNNVFTDPNQEAFDVEGYNTQYARGVTNLNVVNNTFINSGTTGRLMEIEGPVAGITLVNNIYDAPNMYVGTLATAAIYDVETSLSSFTTISNNVWPVPTLSKWIAANVKGGSPFAIIGGDENNISDYYVLSRWNALSQVGTDQQLDLSLNSADASSVTSVTTGGERWPGVFTNYTGAPRSLTGLWSIGAV